MNEKSITSISGYVFLVVALACAALGVYLITHLNEGGGLVLPVLLLLAAVFIFKGPFRLRARRLIPSVL